MNILAIESSADDTGIAILEAKQNGSNIKFKILANKIHTQIDIHTGYGGIFPVIAKREHGRNIIPTMISALKEAKMFKVGKSLSEIKNKKIKKILEKENELSKIFVAFINKIKKPDIDAIAVTVGPGLEPALWVGISTARALSLAWDIPIIPVNHMEGHLLSPLVEKKKTFTYNKKTLSFPVLSLLISGGHTELVLMKTFGKYQVIGQTRDDAAGEAFDKVARMLGLPYPGGPEISRLAETKREEKNYINKVVLPRPMIYSKDFDFSFSGLKTAVLYYIRDNGPLNENMKADIAKEFEDSVIEVLVTKTLKAMDKYKIKSLILGGGVSGNTHLQRTLKNQKKNMNKDIAIHFPTKVLSTDNALMIAIAGYFQYKNKKFVRGDKKLKAIGNLSL